MSNTPSIATETGREPTHMERVLYWTRCDECGEYVIYPEVVTTDDPTWYVCEDCR